MQYNYLSKYLVVIIENTYVSVYKYEKYKFDQPFLSFQAKNIFIGISKICSMTEFSGALKNSNFDGNTILLECEDSKYVHTSGLEIFEFITSDKVIDYISLMGNNMTFFRSERDIAHFQLLLDFCSCYPILHFSYRCNGKRY